MGRNEADGVAPRSVNKRFQFRADITPQSRISFLIEVIDAEFTGIDHQISHPIAREFGCKMSGLEIYQDYRMVS